MFTWMCDVRGSQVEPGNAPETSQRLGCEGDLRTNVLDYTRNETFLRHDEQHGRG